MQALEHTFTAMGGLCRLRLELGDRADANCQAAIAAAVAEVHRLERKYSRYTTDSLTTAINRAAGSGSSVTIDAETAALLQYAQTLWEQSDGLFDLTAGVLRRVWDFKSDVVPLQSAIDQVLPLVDWSQVQWNEESVYLPTAGMEIDFGGCVKEYAADCAAQRLREHDIAAALVDLAGDMVAIGVPAGHKGWPIGIRHPEQKDTALAQVLLPSGALASSGDYERCMVVGGQRYSHILNAKTGWPVRGLVAVSILAEQCLVAGSSATLAMLWPEREALQWLDGLGLPWLAVDAKLKCHGILGTSPPQR